MEAIWYCRPCSTDSGGTVTLEVRLSSEWLSGGDDALRLLCCSGETAPAPSSFSSS